MLMLMILLAHRHRNQGSRSISESIPKESDVYRPFYTIYKHVETDGSLTTHPRAVRPASSSSPDRLHRVWAWRLS